MKRILTILASAVVALTVSSCVKDITTDANSQKGVARTIGANIEAMTRTSMDDFEAGDTAQVVWSEGDVIGVITEDGTIRKATIQAEYAGQVEGVFDVENAVEGEKYIYGYYPYQPDLYNEKNEQTQVGAKYSDGVLTYTLNVNRKFVAATTEDNVLPKGVTFPTNEMPMVGKLNEEKGTLGFKSICGLVEVKLLANNKVSTDEGTGETTTSRINAYHVSLQSDEQVLSGPGVVDMTADHPKFAFNSEIIYGSTGATTISFHSHMAVMYGAQNNGNGFKLDSEDPTSFFFVMPLGTYSDLKIHVGDPSIAVTKISTKAHEIKPNTILSFNAFNIHDVDNIYTGSDVTNLSVNPLTGATEYAYCYLVKPSNEQKKYKFKAVLPDGTRTLKLPDGTAVGGVTSNYNTTYVHAEDTEGVVQNLRREGEWVYFTASKPGNAIIAIGGTNTSHINNYHIWVSDVHDQVLPGGHVFMDRNLGATYAPQTYAEAQKMTTEQVWRSSGCLYQWGSTIPRPAFTPASVGSYNTKPTGLQSSWVANNWIRHKWDANYYNSNYFVSGTTANSLIRTRNYCHQWQQALENVSKDDTSATITNVEDFGVWYRQNILAGGVVEGKALNVGTNALWQSKKTMFDPCPPGYRVPSRKEIADAYTNQGDHTGKNFKISLPSVGFYYAYEDNFVFISWCGYRMASDGRLFNTYFTDYARTGGWYFDESFTEESIANCGLPVRYGTSGGGQDISAANGAGVGGRSTYPYLSIEQTNSNSNKTWKNGSTFYTNNASASAPTLTKHRGVLAMGLGLRCVRATYETMSEGVAPSFEVDTPTDF